MLDISNPAAPVRIGAYAAVSQVVDVELAGTRLFVAHGTGVEILDVSTPSSPVRLGGYATDRGMHSGSRWWAPPPTSGSATRWSALHFRSLNIANPAAPSYLGDFGLVRRSAGSPSWAISRTLPPWMAVFRSLNVATPATITRLATVATAGNARSIDVQSSTAFVAEDAAGLGTFNVQNTSNVVRMSLTNTRGTAMGFQIDSGMAYVADGPGGLAIMSQAAPANTPPVFGSIGVQQTDEGSSVAVYGHRAGCRRPLSIISPMFSWMVLRE